METRNNTIFARLERFNVFQFTTLGIIFLNAIWIFIDVQYNHDKLADEQGRTPLSPGDTVVENIFGVYFFLELLIRFLAYKRTIYCFKDAWFVFDFVLVTLMVVDQWIIPIIQLLSTDSSGAALKNLASLRLLRLLRITRMARLMRFFPELMTLVRSIVNALQAVMWIFLFLAFAMYFFAIVFTVIYTDNSYVPPAGANDYNPTGPMLFTDLGSSMFTLLTIGVLGDNINYTLQQIKQDKPVMQWIFILWIVVSNITLLNMLIGVLCQVIDDSSKEEEEARMLSELKNCLESAFKEIDESGDGLITEEEWSHIRDSDKVRQKLVQLGLEESQLEERLHQMQESIFGVKDEDDPSADSGEKITLNFDEFVDKVLDLRWDTPASALDIEMLKASWRAEDSAIQAKLISIEDSIYEIAAANANPALRFEDLDAAPTEAWLHDVPTKLLVEVLQSRIDQKQHKE